MFIRKKRRREKKVNYRYFSGDTKRIQDLWPKDVFKFENISHLLENNKIKLYEKRKTFFFSTDNIKKNGKE